MGENKRNSEYDFDNDSDEFIKSYAKREFSKNINLTEFKNEADLIELTMEKSIIIHFFSPSFPKCIFMNKALRIIAPKFPKIKFVYINVENAQKMCKSLNIKILPFLGFFKDGLFVDDLIGFEKLGNKNTFEVEDLENFISNSNILKSDIFEPLL